MTRLTILISALTLSTSALGQYQPYNPNVPIDHYGPNGQFLGSSEPRPGMGSNPAYQIQQPRYVPVPIQPVQPIQPMIPYNYRYDPNQRYD